MKVGDRIEAWCRVYKKLRWGVIDVIEDIQGEDGLFETLTTIKVIFDGDLGASSYVGSWSVRLLTPLELLASIK